MMAAESPLSLSPPPAREDLENLTLVDEEQQTSFSAPFTPRLITTVRADLNDRDPLLNPPLSPSPSSSPSSSPTSAASSSPIPTPFTPPIAAANGRSHTAPEFTWITVSDPQKEYDPNAPSSLVTGSSTFVSYLITARSVNGGEFRVRRRFRDVVALADQLAESYRGFFIPARPDKSVVEGQVMQRQEFVEQRRAALEKYLCRLAAHPVVGRSDELHTFLRAPVVMSQATSSYDDHDDDHDDDVAAIPRHQQIVRDGGVGRTLVVGKAGRDLFGMFREIKQNVVNGWVGGVGQVGGPGLLEEDKDFLARKTRVLDLAQQLTTTSQQAEGLVKAQQDMGDTMGDLGMTFVKLGKFETEQSSCQPQSARANEIRRFAMMVVKASRLRRGLNSQTVIHLDTLHEYLGLMMPVNSAFSDRSSALTTVQSLSSELSSLRTRLEKMEVASAKVFGQDRTRARKIEELKESIRNTEIAKHNAVREYERIKENNRTELERLERERHSDFRDMLKGFVVSQVDFSEKIAKEWEKLAEETKGYAKPGH